MKKFCEDEGYDCWKFCKLACEGQLDLKERPMDDKPVFVEVKPDGSVSQTMPLEIFFCILFAFVVTELLPLRVQI